MPLSSLAKSLRVKQVNLWIDAGYASLSGQSVVPACRIWLQVWEIIKELAPAPTFSRQNVQRAYPDLHPEFENWCNDLMYELWNAGLDDPAYHEHRLRFIGEFLNRFPGEDDHHLF